MIFRRMGLGVERAEEVEVRPPQLLPQRPCRDQSNVVDNVRHLDELRRELRVVEAGYIALCVEQNNPPFPY